MNKIKIFKNLNLWIFILSLIFVFITLPHSFLDSYNIWKDIGHFLWIYLIIFVFVYLITRIFISKNTDKRKLYFHICVNILIFQYQ